MCMNAYLFRVHTHSNLRLRRSDDLVLLPQNTHQAVVLLARTRGERGGTRASQGVVLIADWHPGNLSGRTYMQKAAEQKTKGKELLNNNPSQRN